MRVENYVRQAFASALKQAGLTVDPTTIQVVSRDTCGYYDCAWDDRHNGIRDAATGSFFGSSRGGIVRLVNFYDVELQHYVYRHSWHRFRGAKDGVPVHTTEEAY